MTRKTIFAVLAFSLTPALAMADCKWEKINASSCAEGQMFDTKTGACVDKATS
ncbi:hypothetical protein [Actibacterium sp. D379-3]